MEVGSLAEGSLIRRYPGQLSDSQETSMGWEQDGLGRGEGQFYQECLPSPPGGWIRLNVVGVMRQIKLFSVVTGKKNMSKVSPVLGWCQHCKSGISLTLVNDGMVVKTSNSHC